MASVSKTKPAVQKTIMDFTTCMPHIHSIHAQAAEPSYGQVRSTHCVGSAVLCWYTTALDVT